MNSLLGAGNLPASTIRFHKRGADGYFITSGKDLQIKTAVFTAYVDPVTGDLYRNESAVTVATKATLLAAFALPYTAFAMMGNVALAAGRVKGVPKAAYDIGKAPFFGGMLFFTSCYGIICPRSGRKWIDWTERLWHEGGIKQDIRHGMSKRDIDEMDVAAKFFREKKVFYAGFCMQRLGNKADPKYLILP